MDYKEILIAFIMDLTTAEDLNDVLGSIWDVLSLIEEKEAPNNWYELYEYFEEKGYKDLYNLKRNLSVKMNIGTVEAGATITGISIGNL